MFDFLHKNKRPLVALLLLALICGCIYAGSGIVTFAGESKAADDKVIEAAAGTKDEVVYANLSPNGTPHDVYVVNILNIGKSGKVIDYGDYSKVSNLTDTTEIENRNGEITVESDPGVFYYEGYGEDQEMPWIISIGYGLDGKNISTDELAGVSGSLEIRVQTRENKNADPEYFENYMLQISVPMNMDLCSDIDSGGGTTALSGNTTLVNYTVLPGTDGDFSLTADVNDFEMDSISISGIPFSMDFDLDELTSEFDQLISGVAQLDSGMNSLNGGIQQMSSGLDKAGKGSSSINKNLQKINSGTASLSQGSKDINNALAYMTSILSTSGESGDISDLIDGLEEISMQLDNSSKGMNAMISTLDGLAQATGTYPAAGIGIILADPDLSTDPAVLAVVDYVSGAATFIGTYNAMSPSLSAISGGMTTMSGIVDQMATELKPLKDLNKLQAGLAELSNEYAVFNKGLQSYLGGVGAITGYYGKFNSGMKQSAFGADQLAAGSSRLSSGMNTFNSSVQGIPDQINEKMTGILGDGDYTPKSFVSDKNKDINSVQFVMSTDKIKKPKEVKVEEPDNKGKKSIWDKIKGLFK